MLMPMMYRLILRFIVHLGVFVYNLGFSLFRQISRAQVATGAVKLVPGIPIFELILLDI
jgi:hypothetical protein